jgi:hypothetical protein
MARQVGAYRFREVRPVVKGDESEPDLLVGEARSRAPNGSPREDTNGPAERQGQRELPPRAGATEELRLDTLGFGSSVGEVWGHPGMILRVSEFLEKDARRNDRNAAA